MCIADIVAHMCADTYTHVEPRVWFSAHNGGSQPSETAIAGSNVLSSAFHIRHTHGAHTFLEPKHSHTLILLLITILE